MVISRWLAVGLTLYSVATTLLLYYVRTFWHVEALWFANVANQLLWWAYVKAAWRALYARIFCCCARLTFKVHQCPLRSPNVEQVSTHLCLLLRLRCIFQSLLQIKS